MFNFVALTLSVKHEFSARSAHKLRGKSFRDFKPRFFRVESGSL